MYDLTIGIPTYNRADKLEEALKAIIKEVQLYKDKKIEILVSDNCSTDHTEKVIKNLMKVTPISYYKNSENLGYDRNVDNIVRKSQGIFVLFMGDDDILIEEKLSHYLSIIDENRNISIVLGRANYMSHDFNQNFGSLDEAFNKFDTNKVYLFNDGHELFSYTKRIFLGISGIMFNKEKYLKENLTDFYESQWIHVAAVFIILSKKNSLVAVINKPILGYRLGDKTDYVKKQEVITKVGFGMLNLLLKIKPYYSRNIYYTIYNHELKGLRRAIIGVKARDGLTNEILKEYKKLLDNERDNKVIDFFIVYSTDILFKFPYLVYRFIKYGKVNYK